MQLVVAAVDGYQSKTLIHTTKHSISYHQRLLPTVARNFFYMQPLTRFKRRTFQSLKLQWPYSRKQHTAQIVDAR